MKNFAILAAVFLGLSCISPAVASPAFYGTWSCAQVMETAVVSTEWDTEVFGPAGVSLGRDGKPEPLKVRMIRKGVYDLVYADGGRSRISMQQPWMFMRGTMDHTYLCLRTAQ